MRFRAVNRKCCDRPEKVTFIDSDDYIEKEAIEILVNAMTKYNTLIAHMKSYIISSDYKILENIT